MFEAILVALLCVALAYYRIKLVNAEVELEDLRIKYKFAQDTLDKILEKEQE